MACVTVRIPINLPLAQAWELLSDLGQAHHYVPGIVATRMTTKQTKGVGASRTVVRRNGAELDETVTDWWEGRGFQLRLHQGAKDAPFRGAFFRYELNELPAQQTELTASMGYSLPLGALGRLFDHLVLARVIKPIVGDVAVSLKHYYEQGERPNAQTRKALRQTLY